MALDVKISFSWTNYCRLCLLDTGIMLPLFEEEGMRCQLKQKIETCLQLVTYDGDPLPRMICHKCLFKINETYEFRCKAISSYERLKSHLLPLKHVPEVKNYLDKADSVQKSIDLHAVSPSQFLSSMSSQQDNDGANLGRVKIKKEKGNSEDSEYLWSQPNLLDLSESHTPLSNRRSPNLSDLCYEDSQTSSTRSYGYALHGSVKRKRFASSKATASNEDEKVVFSLKRLKGKRQLAGPACSKRGQQNELKCVFCSVHFKSKHTLRLHVDNCLKCSTCKEEFTSVAEKAVHEAEKHISVIMNGERRQLRKTCSKCPARFASSVMLTTHYKYDHLPHTKEISGNQPYLDSSSTASVVHSPNSLSHPQETSCNPDCASEENQPLSELKSESNPLSHDVSGDSVCQKCFQGIESFKCHKCPQDEPILCICDICAELFASERVLDDHRKMVHRQFRCLQCYGGFSSQKALNSHMRCHLKNSKPRKSNSTPSLQKTLSCHTCFEEFEEEDSFIYHLYKHAAEQSDDEKLPKKKSRKTPDTPSRSTIASNRADSEDTVEQFSVKCDRCHVVCRSREYYKVHLANHMSKVKSSFPCSGCGQVFRNVEALNRHTCCGKQSEGHEICCLDCGQTLVQGEDHVCDNKCPVCNKVFKSARGQRLHFMSKHKNQAPDHNEVQDERDLKLDVDQTESEDEQTEQDKEVKQEAELSTMPVPNGNTSYSSKESSLIGDSPPQEIHPTNDAIPDSCQLDSFSNKEVDSILPVKSVEKDSLYQTKDLQESNCYNRPLEMDGMNNSSFNNLLSNEKLVTEKPLDIES